MEKFFYSVEEVAELLAVHPATVRELAREGRLPSAKLRKLWRFPKQRLEEWMAAGMPDLREKEKQL